MKKYDLYEDAGHAWLKVKKSELIALGIANKITSYSYQRGEWAYLEEDCDLTTFWHALMEKTGERIKLDDICRTHISDRPSRIRYYHHYVTPAKARLDYLRQEIIAERISQGEILELQSLAEYIESGDVLLLEWAGVPEKGAES